MTNNNGYFALCGGCKRKEKREGLKDGQYYCIFAVTILPDGIVNNDTDATCCNKFERAIPLMDKE